MSNANFNVVFPWRVAHFTPGGQAAISAQQTEYGALYSNAKCNGIQPTMSPVVFTAAASGHNSSRCSNAASDRVDPIAECSGVKPLKRNAVMDVIVWCSMVQLTNRT